MAVRSIGGTLASGAVASLVAIGTVVTPLATTVAAPEAVDVVEGRRPSISGDGRWLVVQRDVADRSSVFRTDRTTGETIELTPVPDGLRAGQTVNPVLSSDGCVVVVQTELALDVFRDDDSGERWDVYRLVVPECGGALGQWELVSAASGSGTARDDVDVSSPPSVSESGTIVAFTHPIPRLRDVVHTISVVDVTVPLGAPGRTTVLPAMPVEAPTTVYRYRGAIEPALSANGRHLAFTSDATSADALPDWGAGPAPGEWATPQVFVWDRDDNDRTSRVRLISGRDGVPSEAGAGSPAISEDGSIVVFVSADRALVAAEHPRCLAECPTQVYRYDRDADGNGRFDEPGGPDPLTLVSAVDDGPAGLVAGDAPSWGPTVNIDASQVVFVSRAGNLLATRVTAAGDAGDGDLIVAEVPLGSLRRATEAAERGSIPAVHANPAVSATGRVLVFDTAVPSAFTHGEPVRFDEPRQRFVAAIVTSPRLSLAVLDFGTVLTGWTSDELYVSVLNEGPGAFAPGYARSTSPYFTVVDGGTCTRGLVVPAGDTCTVHVTFNPSTTAAFAGTLVVTEDDPVARVPTIAVDDPADDPADDPVEFADDSVEIAERVVPKPIDPMVVETRVVGNGGEPTLRAEPAGTDLGTARVGGAGERRAVDVRNVSSAPTEIASVVFGGDHPDDFLVTSESCTDRALNPGATCTVEVELRPTAAHRRTASLVVTTTTGEYTAALTGGVGRYDPVLVSADASPVAGRPLGLGVEGFPPEIDVHLSFDDSTRILATIRTDPTGGVLAVVDIPRRERAGSRVLVATGPDGVVATTALRVERPFDTPAGVPGYGTG